jgi:hypothetical protein
VEGQANSQRRRLQRFVEQAQPLEHFFGLWTRSVLRRVKVPKGQPMVLVVDETKVEDRFGVMVVGVACEGRVIPLAWRVYRANDGAAYPPEGQARMIIRLLKQVRAGLPPRQRVRGGDCQESCVNGQSWIRSSKKMTSWFRILAQLGKGMVHLAAMSRWAR